jgi:HlyD family secretion protein
VPNAALRYAPPRQSSGQGFNITSLFIPRMPRSEKTTVPSADGERTVHVLEDGKPKAVKVRVGVSDGKDTQILSGDIKAGDEVILSSKAGGP